MDKFIVHGGKPLVGDIEISGAKNAVLPLMLTTLLTDEDIILHNVPYLADVVTMCELLRSFGVQIEIYDQDHRNIDIKSTKLDSFSLLLNSAKIHLLRADYEITKKMRASFWALGPMLAKFGQAEVSLPGGCSIGTRQIDLHLDTLKALGAEILLEDGYVKASAKSGLKATEFTFNKVSVGATVNAIMSAVLSDGTSTFKNCASEPEIQNTCQLLVKMGAKIKGIGTNNIVIEGQQKLHGAEFTTMPDRIETGSYIAAIGLTGGNLRLHKVDVNSIKNIIDIFSKTGIEIQLQGDVLSISSDKKIRPVNIDTMPYPGFPTDLQAQFTALMCLADGTSSVTENLFENRFMHIPELQRMGANITVKKNTAIIQGISSFHGANVMATDLRASVCLVLAALVAPEQTVIDRIYHIDRGYCRIEKKLRKCGANIERIKGH